MLSTVPVLMFYKSCILYIFLFVINNFLFGMNIFGHLTLEITLAVPAKMTTNTTS